MFLDDSRRSNEVSVARRVSKREKVEMQWQSHPPGL